MNLTKSIPTALVTCLCLLLSLSSCGPKQVEEINIGYIGPLSVRAVDLGVDPSNAMQLAIDQYNANRADGEPKINLFIEDDQWNPKNAIPVYNKLREEHNVEIVFVSNTNSNIRLQEKILEDGVILVNPLNNGKQLNVLNKNTFQVAKDTEQANGLIAIRIIELGLKKVALFQFPNVYMTRASEEVERLLDNANIEIHVVPTEVGQTTFKKQLEQLKSEEHDAYVFFGYKEFGFAMKEARDMGITAPFFGSTVLLDPEFYNNSEGAIIGTEYPFFTPADGNRILVNEFLADFEKQFNKKPVSVWPTMQAYDATNLVLSRVRTINQSKDVDSPFDDWLRESLLKVNYYQGICGNIAIKKEGGSKGIYFSLYKYDSKENPIVKVKR
ncbi:ABC transporter substrate-binding protein [Flavobacteriaceae bacterium A100]|uniref:ABC transporter substrate-binding protein n=1 Tax=Oceanihabitans sediminis TaxID=1812012 RepID=UPI000930CBF2